MENTVGEIFSLLHKWGIHTAGQFAALDKEELAARLGPEAVRMWERASGKSRQLLRLVRPPESFRESFEFDYEIETAEPLLFILRRFLEQLTLRLSAIYLVPKELTLRITFSNSRQKESAVADKKIYEHVFKIPQPTGDVDLLFRMLQTHLENFQSDHPIVAVALDAHPTRPAGQQFGLFESTLRNPQQLAETLACLTALLGADRVGRPVLEDTHRPDAFRMEPFAWDSTVDANETDDPHPTLSLRERRTCVSTAVREGVALRRFRPSLSASVLLDENKPVHLHSAQINGKVEDQRGPYLLSGNWWDEKSWACPEWDVQLEEGTICRSFHNDNGWQIEGIYD
jgi:protein ImuB